MAGSARPFWSIPFRFRRAAGGAWAALLPHSRQSRHPSSEGTASAARRDRRRTVPATGKETPADPPCPVPRSDWTQFIPNDSFLRHQRIGGRFLGISVTDRCRLRPSRRVRPRLNTMSGYAEFGPGQYLTDITPERALPGPSAGLSADQVEQGFMSRWQLSHRLTTTPWNASNLTHFVEIDVSDLNVLSPRPGTFLIPGEDSLDLSGRIIRGGPF